MLYRNVGLRKKSSPTKLIKAKEMRRNPTHAEEKLWKFLRCEGFQGLKFRRQSVIRGWIVDFWCPLKKVVVEVDGGYHTSFQKESEDAYRDGIMTSLGITVVRVTNAEVLVNMDLVLRKIGAAIPIGSFRRT